MTNDTGVSTINTWHTFMRPVLEALSDGAIHVKRDMERAAMDIAGLTEAERLEQLESGQLHAPSVIDPRVGPHLTYFAALHYTNCSAKQAGS